MTLISCHLVGCFQRLLKQNNNQVCCPNAWLVSGRLTDVSGISINEVNYQKITFVSLKNSLNFVGIKLCKPVLQWEEIFDVDKAFTQFWLECYEFR